MQKPSFLEGESMLCICSQKGLNWPLSSNQGTQREWWNWAMLCRPGLIEEVELTYSMVIVMLLLSNLLLSLVVIRDKVDLS